MLFFISKIFQPLLWPFNLGLLLLLSGLLLQRFSKNQRLARRLVAFSFCFFFIPALPLIAHPLLKSLESQFPSFPVEQASSAEVIVVLGGTVLGIDENRPDVEEANGSRLVPAARLYHARKAGLILVSSGYSYLSHGKHRTEAQDMQEFLRDQGIPDSRILVENQSRNTDENARYSAALLREKGIEEVLLVTSAFHLPRAVALFKKHGYPKVIPFPTERRITGSFVLKDFLPSLAALQISTVAIKEYVGRWVYGGWP